MRQEMKRQLSAILRRTYEPHMQTNDGKREKWKLREEKTKIK